MKGGYSLTLVAIAPAHHMICKRVNINGKHIIFIYYLGGVIFLKYYFTYLNLTSIVL